MGSPPPPRAPQLRQRSMAAVVLSRASSSANVVTADTATNASVRRRWPTIVLWIVLGAAIAALWGLLLFGDSLQSVSG